MSIRNGRGGVVGERWLGGLRIDTLALVEMKILVWQKLQHAMWRKTRSQRQVENVRSKQQADNSRVKAGIQ